MEEAIPDPKEGQSLAVDFFHSADQHVSMQDGEITPLDKPPEVTEDILKRTVALRGYNKETTIEQLSEFYKEAEPAVVLITMRLFSTHKHRTPKFQGCTYMVFATEEDCKTYLSAESESKSYKGNKLDRICAMELPKIKRMLNPEASTNDKRKLQAGKEPVDKDSKRQKREEGQRIEARGAVLKLSGVEGEAIKREDLKALLMDKFEAKKTDFCYIDFMMGQSEAKIRFWTENAAVELMKKIEEKADEDKLLLKGCSLVASVMEGEEEEAYLVEAQKNRDAVRAKKLKSWQDKPFRGGRVYREKKKAQEMRAWMQY